MSLKTYLESLNPKVLILLAENKNEEWFTILIKDIVKTRYLDYDIHKLELMIKKTKNLEFDILSELIIDKSILEECFFMTSTIDYVIDNLDFNYLMNACKNSKNLYIRNKAYERMQDIFDEIESVPDIKDELEEKIKNDEIYIKRRLMK